MCLINLVQNVRMSGGVRGRESKLKVLGGNIEAISYLIFSQTFTRLYILQETNISLYRFITCLSLSTTMLQLNAESTT